MGSEVRNPGLEHLRMLLLLSALFLGESQQIGKHSYGRHLDTSSSSFCARKAINITVIFGIEVLTWFGFDYRASRNDGRFNFRGHGLNVPGHRRVDYSVQKLPRGPHEPTLTWAKDYGQDQNNEDSLHLSTFVDSMNPMEKIPQYL